MATDRGGTPSGPSNGDWRSARSEEEGSTRSEGEGKAAIKAAPSDDSLNPPSACSTPFFPNFARMEGGLVSVRSSSPPSRLLFRVGAISDLIATTFIGGGVAAGRSAITSGAPISEGGSTRPNKERRLGRSGDSDAPADPASPSRRFASPSCRGFSSRRVACQYVGLILLGSPFSLTHACASADQRASSKAPVASSSRRTTWPSLAAVSIARRI